MISIHLNCDALAVNALGCYGNEWIATPTLDKWAHEGMVFDHVFMPLDVHPGGWHRHSFQPILQDLQKAGIHTQVFHEGISTGDEHPLDLQWESLLSWIDTHPKEKGALWVDLKLAPSSWAPSVDILERLLGERDPIDLFGKACGTIGEGIDIDVIDALRDTYAARMEELDRRLESLIAGLRQRGVWEQGLVSFTADQGWPLGEHDAVGFAKPWCHEERDHVPLLLKPPGKSAFARSPALVSCFDLGATIADYFGVEFSPESEGKSLLPLSRGEPIALREYVVGGFSNEEFYLRTQPWKLILPWNDENADRPRQLYSKPEDRWEVNDLAEQKVDIADHLELALRRHLDALAQGSTQHLPLLRRDVLFPTS